MKFTKKQVKKILEYVKDTEQTYSLGCEAVKASMHEIDLRYNQASKAYLKACQDAYAACEDDDCILPENVQPPVVLASTESAVAFLVQIFLSDPSAFSLMGKPEIQEELEKLESIMISQERDFAWKPELISAIRNLVKYNFCFSTVSWKSLSVLATAGQAELVADSGIDISNISPYTCIWDTTCQNKDFQYDGMFWQTDEYLTLYQLLYKIQKLNAQDTNLNTKFLKDLSKQDIKEWNIYNPILDVAAMGIYGLQSASKTDWESLFDNGGMANADYANSTRSFTGLRLTKGYIRARGKDIEAIGDTFNVYEYWIVNDTELVYFKQMPIAVFDVVMGTGILDGLNYNTRSLVTPTIIYQDVAEKLIQAKLEATRRLVYDRGIYNPKYVSATNINSPRASNKIPLRANVQGDENAIAQAYQQIPYRDTQSGTLLVDAQLFMDKLPADATGVSKFRQEPQKGNRSATEFNFLSEAGDGRLKLFAITIEGTFFSIVKSRIKYNLVVNQPGGEGEEGESINYSFLESKGFDFAVVDGLTSLGILDDMEAVQAFANLAAQNEAFGPIVFRMLEYILQARTNLSLKDFTYEAQPQQTAQPPAPVGEDGQAPPNNPLLPGTNNVP